MEFSLKTPDHGFGVERPAQDVGYYNGRYLFKTKGTRYVNVTTDYAKLIPYLLFPGLFHFDSRFRPVPLEQTFIGVKSEKAGQQANDMNEICYDKVVDFVRKGHQVMVFVHARNATVKTAMALMETARNSGELQLFEPDTRAEGAKVRMHAVAKAPQEDHRRITIMKTYEPT